MAVYYKNGVKYVGSAAEREMKKDNKKTTSSSNTSTSTTSNTNTSNKPSGGTTTPTTSVTSGGSSNNVTNNQYTQGNYVIGSDYGKQQAQNMGIGTSWTATDGSIWTKENDGTITVRHNGTETKNAYTPTDLGILGSQQVEAGLPYQYVEGTLYDRLDKIASNPELSQYANDGTYWKMYNYIQDQKQKEEYNNNLEEFNQNRPEDYQGKYDPQMDALLKEILNRDDFSYDVMNDPLYQQYANMYRREGDRAMKETMAEAAAGAGGMNTYAITAAQQANSYYNSQLNDKIPELYQLAYDMYLRDKESKVQDLGLLQQMDATQYARYRDTMSDFRDDRNFALGLYNDAVAQGNWNKNFDFNTMVDNRNFGYDDFWNNKNFNYNDEWRNKEWDYNDEWKNKEWEDQQSDQQYDRDLYSQKTAYDQIVSWIENGVTSFSPELVEKAGLTQEEVNLLVTAVQGQQAKTGKTSSGKGNGGGGGGNGYTQETEDDEDDGYEGDKDDNPDETQNDNPQSDVGKTQETNTTPFASPFNYDTIEKLVRAGVLILNEDGSLEWVQGYGPHNAQEVLNNLSAGFYPFAPATGLR